MDLRYVYQHEGHMCPISERKHEELWFMHPNTKIRIMFADITTKSVYLEVEIISTSIINTTTAAAATTSISIIIINIIIISL